MPAFFILAVIGIVLLWFLLAFLYKPIGKLFSRIFKEAADELTKEDIEQHNETKETSE